MIDLTPSDRLKTHLILHCPNVKMKHVRLSSTPGFLEVEPSGQIDIRGAGYGPGNARMRLWDELHGHFAAHVQVIKQKNKIPTLIEWNGMIYHLDQNRSFMPSSDCSSPIGRRNQPARSREGVTATSGLGVKRTSM